MTSRRKYKSPAEIREDNVTPLDIGLLGDYMDEAADDYFNLVDLRQQQHKASLVQAGTYVIPSIVKQTSDDELVIVSDREKAAAEMLKIVKQVLKLAKHSKLKLPQGKRRLIDGISLKDINLIKKKAQKKYQGDMGRVVDPVRCTILAGDVNDLQLLSEIFRPCSDGVLLPNANFEVLRYRNEFNRINPEKGGIRRIQANIKMPEVDGYVGEIMVFFGPSAAKYDISRNAYGKQRGAEDALDRSYGKAGYEAVVVAGTMAKNANKERTKANQEAVDFPEVRALVMQQTAYEINDFPVIINEDGREGQAFALVPNPASGVWETDQRFLDVIQNPEAYPDLKIIKSNIHEAKIRGEALCRNSHLIETLRAEI